MFDALKDIESTGDVVWVRPLLNAEGEQVYDQEYSALVLELGQTPHVEASIYSYDHGRGYVEAMAAGIDAGIF